MIHCPAAPHNSCPAHQAIRIILCPALLNADNGPLAVTKRLTRNWQPGLASGLSSGNPLRRADQSIMLPYN